MPMLEELLGDLSGNGAGAPPAAQVERSPAPRVRVHTKDSDQAQICLGVPSYPIEHPDRYSVQLLATVLGGGMSSRLFLEVRERRGLAYYVYGTNQSYTDAGTLVAQAGVDIERIDQAVGTVVEQFRRMAEETVPADEPRRGHRRGRAACGAGHHRRRGHAPRRHRPVRGRRALPLAPRVTQ